MGTRLASCLPPTLLYPPRLTITLVRDPGAQRALQASVLFLPTTKGEIRLAAVGHRLAKVLALLGVVKIDEITRETFQ